VIWAWSQSLVSNQSTVASGTGITTPFSANVTAGNVVVLTSLFLTTGASVPTFSDTSNNVTRWNSTGQQIASGPGFSLAEAWGIPTFTGVCTPKIVWSTGGTQIMELFGGEFSISGMVSQDGTLGFVNQSSLVTAISVTGVGTQNSDLLVAMIGAGSNFASWGGAWQPMGASVGDDAGYLLNAPGNSVATATQSSNAGYGALVIALRADNTQYVPRRMPLGA